MHGGYTFQYGYSMKLKGGDYTIFNRNFQFFFVAVITFFPFLL